MKRTAPMKETEAQAKLAESQARAKITREKNLARKRERQAEETRKLRLQQTADAELHPPLSVDERAELQTSIDAMRADLELIRAHATTAKELNRAVFYLRNTSGAAQ